MPSQLLHTLFGEDVVAGICQRVENRFADAAARILTIPGAHRKAFALGCQGPDIFYHSRRRRPVGLEYGTLLHRRGIGTFCSELLKNSLPAVFAAQAEGAYGAYGAYALGFMTHAILDRQAHPYIVYKTWLPSNHGFPGYAQAHTFFERIIDALMLKHLRGSEITSWDQEGLLAETCASPPPGLKELLSRTLVFAFPERAGKDEKLEARIINTFHDSAVFYRMSAPANVAQKRMDDSLSKDHLVYVYPEELPANIDFLNLEKRPWFYPAGEETADTRSFPEIYAGAVAAAADSLSGIIVRYLEEASFQAEEAARVIGNGGLSIVDGSGAPCPPCRSDPLPLDDVIEQQVIMRRSGKHQ